MAREPRRSSLAAAQEDAVERGARSCKRCKRRATVDASQRCHACRGAVHPSCSARVAMRDCGLPLGFPGERAFCSRRCYESVVLAQHQNFTITTAVEAEAREHQQRRQREATAKRAALAQSPTATNSAARVAAATMAALRSIASTPVVSARTASVSTPTTMETPVAPVVTDSTLGRPVTADNAQTNTPAPAPSSKKSPASRKSPAKKKLGARSRAPPAQDSAPSLANGVIGGDAIIPPIAIVQSAAPQESAPFVTPFPTVASTRADPSPRRAPAKRTPLTTRNASPALSANTSAAPSAVPANTRDASPAAATADTRHAPPPTVATSRTASPAVQAASTVSLAMSASTRGALHVISANTRDATPAASTSRSATPAVPANVRGDSPAAPATRTASTAVSDTTSGPPITPATRTPPAAALVPVLGSAPPVTRNAPPATKATPPGTRTATPHGYGSKTESPTEAVDRSASSREAGGYGPRLRDDGGYRALSQEPVSYGAPAPEAVGYAPSAFIDSRLAAAECDLYAAPAARAELVARASAYGAPAAKGVQSAVPTGWWVADAGPIMFPVKDAPLAFRTAASAASPSSVPPPLQRLPELPDRITFVLSILIGEIGRTTRKCLSTTKFRFQLSDGFEAFLAEANAWTAQEFQRHAANAYEAFVRTDRAVYIRPKSHSKQSEVVELTEKNFISRITRTYHNFIKSKSADEHSHYECAIVTYVNKDTSRSALGDPPTANPVTTRLGEPPASASPTHHHNFMKYTDQQCQQQQYNSRHPPAVMATDNPVIFMPARSGVSPVTAVHSGGNFNGVSPHINGGYPICAQKRTHSQMQFPGPSTGHSQSDVDDSAYKTIRMVLNGLVVPVKVNVHDLLACTGLLNQPPARFWNREDSDDDDTRMRRRLSPSVNAHT